MLLFVVPQAVSLLMCCCTLGARPNTARSIEPASIPVACELCCHESPTINPNHDHLDRPSQGCPCRQMMVSLMIGTPGTLEVGTPVETIHSPETFVIDSPNWFSAPILAPAFAGELAFHPPDERQRYHHVLRC
jgi:hypothetical protein